MKYNEIFRLKEMMERKNIPFEFNKLYDGYQLSYPKANTKENPYVRECSVIEHFGSYGNGRDLLEIMGLLTPEESECDEVVGYLSAENVFERISKHYKERTNEV